MKAWIVRWVLHAAKWQYLAVELMVAIALVSIVTMPAAEAKRLQERSLFMNSSRAGDTTFYRLSFQYMSPDPVGSVDLLFCNDPIPYHPCVKPAGLDVSQVTLGSQTGETGFSISSKNSNHLVLSRAAQAPVQDMSSYTLEGVVNPTNPDYAISIRIRTHATTDATGPQIDFGSVRGQITESIEIVTQVPPMLIFCLSQRVEYNCTSTDETYYSDMGDLSPNSTLTAQSQMAVGTNASGGFVITANGAPMSAGTSIIQSLASPVPSRPGQNQFGINLVANDEPVVGNDPEGDWMNATVVGDYGQPNRYKFRSGDVVAFSPNVSLMKKFTVSYIVNSSHDLRPGIYTTSINFIASGRF